MAGAERGWVEAARDDGVVSALERIYDEVARAVEERGPACWASGRCCHFERAGHRLYVTGLEAAITLRRVREARADDGAGGRVVALPVLGGDGAAPPIDEAAVEAARRAGGCPFQTGNLCGAHAQRPLGCRVYFCDRSAQEWQRELYEWAQAAIRAAHERFGVAYVYGEWRDVLVAALRGGG